MSVRVVWEGAEVRRRVLTQSCNLCDAMPGCRCVTKTGRPAHHWHAVRWYAAVRAGAVPVFYQNGEPLP